MIPQNLQLSSEQEELVIVLNCSCLYQKYVLLLYAFIHFLLVAVYHSGCSDFLYLFKALFVLLSCSDTTYQTRKDRCWFHYVQQIFFSCTGKCETNSL